MTARTTAYLRHSLQVLSLLGPALGWLLLFFLGPLLVMLVYSFAERGTYGEVIYALSPTNYLQALKPIYLLIYWRSFWLALTTTLLCLLLAYPVAYFIALKAPKQWKSTLLVLSVIPFWTSFLVRTYAWVVLLRTEGVINSILVTLGFSPLKLLYTDFAVLIGLVYGELPFMLLPIYASIERLDLQLLEAAKDLGATPLEAFLYVTLPLTRAGIITGITLCFIPSLGMFITSDMLGGAKVLMIGNLIQNQFVQRNQPFGAALSFLLTGVVLLLLWISLRAGAKVR
ncbi:MAG: ABC transporter permease [Acidobacteriota bacterium]|nr:ABC transporter permease [Blastocatellia bacterium]MDW8412834.1 ABC transporter permease [Acidobacteriota bacterium]